jgi:iron complex outermembrane receptor protein
MLRLTFWLLFIIPVCSVAQNCDLVLSGRVLDEGTDIVLPYASVYLEEVGTGVITDSTGAFRLTDLCPGTFHLEVSHVGCGQEHLFLNLRKDTTINIYLQHHTELLDEVVVHGSREDNTAQASSTVGKALIKRESNKNLSDLLESISGVSVLRNGSGISKPVVHGLYGNRVAILNNGILQSGQQWGNDHAPEIDPFVADHLSVVKGASALAYGGNALGSVVLVEPGSISDDPHLSGSVNYIFESNGLGNTLNTQLEKNGRFAAWRLTGTLKLRGDTRAPDYFLTNTGKREGNIALQLQKQWSKRWHTELYYSLFNTEIGILRGSHVGNLTDLESSLDRAKPFYTEDEFSYAINAPRQFVQHHMLKVESKYFISESQVIGLKYGGQLNDRKEYDVRRSGRSDIPSLSINQYAHFGEGYYQRMLNKDWRLKTGLQFQLIDNANEAGTGILPLLPRYETYTPSAYLIMQRERGPLFLEWGGRYDYRWMEVRRFAETDPLVIEKVQKDYHNYAFSAGMKYKVHSGLKLSLNAGYMLRAPDVNELFASGLHQGVSGIEEGQENLQQERSFKVVGTVDWFWREKLFVQGLAYYQLVDDFIYLQPQEDFRLTIRGAFPVFHYEQTDARLYGTDCQITFAPVEQLKWTTKYAIVRGRDLDNSLGLVNTPADNLLSTLRYNFANRTKWQNSYVLINGRYVWRQSRIDESQDFLLPPGDYFLLGAGVGTAVKLPNGRLEFGLQFENALNTTYRDYLNRLRYFADEPGINIILRLNYTFNP